MNIFQKYLAEEFAEEYEEGRMTRREALKMIASVTGSLFVAQTMLAACIPPPAEVTEAATLAATEAALPAATATTGAATALPNTEPAPTGTTAETAARPEVTSGTVTPDDPAVVAEAVEFPGNDGAALMGYLAHPSREGSFPVVLVCHENRGLTDHIRDVTRRLAKAGYVGLAVDLLSRQGGSAALGESGVPGALGGIAPDQFVEDFKSGVVYLQAMPYAETDRLGMVGFCFGGGVTWRVATQVPELKAAVPFYGPAPSASELPNIQAAVLAMYGELDSRINGSIPSVEAAMQENGKVYEKMIYPGADHAFHNDTSTRYNAEAAKDAWARTIAWFGEYL
jgi:carboxymethylenebutenolidase